MSKYVYHAGLMPTIGDVSPTTGKTCGHTTLIVSGSQLRLVLITILPKRSGYIAISLVSVQLYVPMCPLI